MRVWSRASLSDVTKGYAHANDNVIEIKWSPRRVVNRYSLTLEIR